MNMLAKILPLILVCLPTLTADAQERKVNYEEAKVPEYRLPPILEMPDGTAITDANAWTTKGRPATLEQFRTHVYGRAPMARPSLRFKVQDREDQALQGKARRRQVTLYFSDDDQGPQVNLLIYLPVKAARPSPVFLGLNFQGNHTIHADPHIPVTQSWVRNNKDVGAENHQASAEGRGRVANRWPVEKITAAGYGLATAYYGDIDPDFDDGFRNGVHTLAGEKAPAADEWGSIATWAWGLSYVMDYLQQDAEIDPKRIILMGHSRLGKTSLWAGAEDERFSIVISNNSGCGGAALHRREFGETVKIINNAFPHWFCDNFTDYSERVDACPVDQHQLIGLIAPRPVYVASAADDRWADPRGEFLSCVHASPLYELLGTDGIAQQEMPGIESPIFSTVGYHIRSGKHDVTHYDWEQWIKFANKHLGSP